MKEKAGIHGQSLAVTFSDENVLRASEGKEKSPTRDAAVQKI